jgi:hypothetical protein
LLLAMTLPTLVVACGGDDSPETLDDTIAAYNDYVYQFSAPIADTAAECLSTSLGSVRAAPCQKWIKWTQEKDQVIDNAITKLRNPIGDKKADQYRKVLLSTLQEYRKAYSEASIAISQKDQTAWNVAIARFRAAQEQGKQADALRYSILQE